MLLSKATVTLIIAASFMMADSFSPVLASRRTTAIFSDFGTAMPDASASPYEQLGIKEEQLALGVNPEELLTYVGTRQDLIERTLKDVDKFDRATAESQVDKFLMDQEAVNMMIEFYKRKQADPEFKVPSNEEEKEGFFSFRTVVFFYLGYVAYTTVPVLFRRWAEDKEWSGTNIPFIDEWLASGGATDTTSSSLSESVDAATQTAATLPDASTIVQTVTDAVDTVQSISDALP